MSQLQDLMGLHGTGKQDRAQLRSPRTWTACVTEKGFTEKTVEYSQTLHAHEGGDTKLPSYSSSCAARDLPHSSLQGFPGDETPARSKLLTISLLCIIYCCKAPQDPPLQEFFMFIILGFYLALTSVTAMGVCSSDLKIKLLFKYVLP